MTNGARDATERRSLVTWGWPNLQERHGHGGAVVVGGWESQLQGEALQEWVSRSQLRSDER
ncbi:MAG TPA: hypothetical protein VFA10_06740 [Ktedonobacteraceae bacterium]|nr:hypothetical protein [Ktedonobacteraceae bacterium]